MYYYFNKNTDSHGNHEVHTSTCGYLPSDPNRTYLGEFLDCSHAIAYASMLHPSYKFDGCYWCCKSCHNG